MIESTRKILLVTRNLPPLLGGMERLNWHMAAELARGAEVRVIGPKGAAAYAPPGVEMMEVPLRPLWKFLAFATSRAVREARRWRPSVVLAGSGLTALPAWIAARLSGSLSAAYVHGLDITVRHPLYRALWLPVLRRMDRVVANSRPTAALAEKVGIASARIGIVHPGVALPDELDDPQAMARFRAEHGLGERPILLSVGRLTARKGLRELVLEALPRIALARPDVMLLVVGDIPVDALHTQVQTPDSIRSAAADAGMTEKVAFLGTITDAELGVVYRAADVHVFPVRELPGDPEGFGMVAIEAAVHDLPTVAFAAGGVVDAVAEGESGRLIPPGDYAAFAQGVVDVLAEREALRASCQRFGRRFEWSMFGQALAEELPA